MDFEKVAHWNVQQSKSEDFKFEYQRCARLGFETQPRSQGEGPVSMDLSWPWNQVVDKTAAEH